jgi:membrane associated rhomboid family serine protease
MIPLRDNVGVSHFSPINLSIILCNLAVFAYQTSLGPTADRLYLAYGLIPAHIAAVGAMGPTAAGRTLLTLLTSLFLHGGLLHIAGNMLYLFIFGPAVEAAFGHLRYAIFYLAAGIAAGLAMVWMSPAMAIPTVGASGAIAAVLGAYFVLYPKAWIKTLLPLFIIVEFVEVPALLYLLLWFGIQLYAGLHSRGPAMAGDVAWWAHIGGFLFGVAVAPFISTRPGRSRHKRAS